MDEFSSRAIVFWVNFRCRNSSFGNSGFLMAIQILQVGLENRSVLNPILERAREDLSSTLNLVKPIIEDVKNRGDMALREYTRKFDNVAPDSFVLDLSRFNPKIDSKLEQALKKAAENIKTFHQIQIPEDKEIIVHGNRLGIRHTPVESVSVYAPGGKALYPSTILMGVIPAKLAGVKIFKSLLLHNKVFCRMALSQPQRLPVRIVSFLPEVRKELRRLLMELKRFPPPNL